MSAIPVARNDTASQRVPSLNPPDVESFYHLNNCELAGQACQGTGCFAARHLNKQRWANAIAQEQKIYCLGQCFAAPAVMNGEAHPRVEVRCAEPIVLRRIRHGPIRSIDGYVRSGGYVALERAFAEARSKIIDALETSGLHGRGGAAFPTGRKWRAAAALDPGRNTSSRMLMKVIPALTLTAS